MSKINEPEGQTVESFLMCKYNNINEIIDSFRYYFLNDANYFNDEIKTQIHRTIVELTDLKKQLQLELIIEKTKIQPENILTFEEAEHYIKEKIDEKNNNN